MYLSLTLSSYIARRFLSTTGVAFGALLGLAFLIDLLNLGDRASTREETRTGLVLEMALLRTPYMAQEILPFVILFGAMFAYIRLTRTHELVVSRTAGVSVWQFLLPSLTIALALGSFAVTVFSPLASVTTARFEQLETTFLRGQSSRLAVSSGGLWLREGDSGRRSVVHAGRVAAHGAELGDVIVFRFERNDRFVERVDAETAVLADGYWDMANVSIARPDATVEAHDRLRMPTELTVERIQNSFAPPETMSFWELPGFIETMERVGFSATRHEIYWHALLSTPLLLAAMVLVAAAFSLRLTRRGKIAPFVVAGLGCGFLLYFLSDVSLALGMSGKLPPALSAWAPAAIFAMIGGAALFHLEDG